MRHTLRRFSGPGQRSVSVPGGTLLPSRAFEVEAPQRPFGLSLPTSYSPWTGVQGAGLVPLFSRYLKPSIAYGYGQDSRYWQLQRPAQRWTGLFWRSSYPAPSYAGGFPGKFYQPTPGVQPPLISTPPVARPVLQSLLG